MSKRYNIIYKECIKSTNEWVKMHIADLADFTILHAGYQTEGRGQGDHTWESDKGANLLLTILLKDHGIAPRDQFAISAITALSLIELLEDHGITARIKLPNDIYVEGKKISGLLIEHTVRGSQITSSIVGVGLNVNQTIFSPELPNPVSMKILTGMTYSTHNLLDQLAAIFSRRFDNYIKNGDIRCLRSEFDSFSLSMH